MGMAASQARLLTLTARLADNELRAQSINNAKMRLAAESSRVSENYINALNNATLVFTNYDMTGASVAQPLTFNALSAYSSYNTQYGLVNSAGQLLVSEAEAKMFKEAGGNLNAYLAAHGLNYTTTYFEKIGNMSTEYPVPFDNISVDEMQEWYEEYVAFTSSSEMEEYQDLYDDYVSATKKMNAMMEGPLDTYLGGEANFTSMNGLSADMIWRTFDVGTKTCSFENLKNAGFLKDFDSFELEAGYLADSYGGMDYPKTVTHDTDEKLYVMSSDDEGNVSYMLDGMLQLDVNEDGNVTKIKYLNGAADTVENSTAFADKTVVYYNETAIFDDNTPGGVIADYPLTNSATLQSVLSGLKVSYAVFDSNANDFKNTYNTTFSGFKANTMEVTSTTTYLTEDSQLEALNQFYDSMISLIKSHTDYGKFAQYMLNKMNEVSSISNYLDDYTGVLSDNERAIIEDCINAGHVFLLPFYKNENIKVFYKGYIEEVKALNNGTTPQGKALAMLFAEQDDAGNQNKVALALNNYLISKEEFLSFIFGDNLTSGKYTFKDEEGKPYSDEATILEAIEKGWIKEEELTDVEAVLAIVKELMAQGENQGKDLTIDNFLSEDYQNTIKVFIIDEMIAQFGEAKYAWIDDNDTQNTGNADAKAQWYTNLFNRMQKGYKTLEDGLAASAQWIEYALESGIVTMEQVDKSYNWTPLSFKTCTRITEETDEAAVAVAEAEYARAMNDIEAKDNAFDMQLKNIDTEHSALQTEYDSVKSVIGKNIDRTFKFNQSA